MLDLTSLMPPWNRRTQLQCRHYRGIYLRQPELHLLSWSFVQFQVIRFRGSFLSVLWFRHPAAGDRRFPEQHAIWNLCDTTCPS